MKRLVAMSSRAWAVLAVSFAIVCVLALMNVAGGVNRDYVASRLSWFVDDDVARKIVNDDPGVDAKTLEDLSRKWFIDADVVTVLLLHPNFPQERRSEMIRNGEEDFYLGNAALRKSLTDEDILALLDRAKGRIFRRKKEIGWLRGFLDEDSVKAETKEAIRDFLYK